MERCLSPVLDLIIIDKSASFVKLLSPLECGSSCPQLMGENHLIDLLEKGKINTEKSKHIFSFKIKAIDTKFLRDNIDRLDDLK